MQIDKYSISDLQHQIPSPYQNIPAGYTLLDYKHNSQTYLSAPYHLPRDVGITTTGPQSTSVFEGIQQGYSYSDIH